MLTPRPSGGSRPRRASFFSLNRLTSSNRLQLSVNKRTDAASKGIHCSRRLVNTPSSPLKEKKKNTISLFVRWLLTQYPSCGCVWKCQVKGKIANSEINIPELVCTPQVAESALPNQVLFSSSARQTQWKSIDFSSPHSLSPYFFCCVFTRTAVSITYGYKPRYVSQYHFFLSRVFKKIKK